MANVTDPLIRAVQGTDPQNIMEYITRQKIYDSRYWKETCFGLNVADVLELAASSLTCLGGTMGSASQRPTKFLCLTLKLLQLQPESELIMEEFITPQQQRHPFKYARALGAFYLRLTGRPADIYNTLEPLYGDFCKLRFRQTDSWQSTHMDEIVHDLLTKNTFCGITLPRLPFRDVLEQEGYLEQDGPRKTLLQSKILKAGGLDEYLHYKAHVEKSPAAVAFLQERRFGKETTSTFSTSKEPGESQSPIYEDTDNLVEEVQVTNSTHRTTKRKTSEIISVKQPSKKCKKEKKGYGTLFKTKTKKKESNEPSSKEPPSKEAEEESDEYWNAQRAKLGLKPLTFDQKK